LIILRLHNGKFVVLGSSNHLATTSRDYCGIPGCREFGLPAGGPSNSNSHTWHLSVHIYIRVRMRIL